MCGTEQKEGEKIIYLNINFFGDYNNFKLWVKF